MTERFLRESRASFHLLNERIREDRSLTGREQVLSLIFGILPGATRRWTSFFSEKLTASTRRQNSTRVEIMPRSRMSVLHRFKFGVSDPAMHILLLRDSAHPMRAGEFAALQQMPSLLLRTSGHKLEPSPYGSSFTRIQLTLPAPRQDEGEAFTPRASRFGPSPPLQYAKQGALIAQELAGSLRDLKQSLSDIAKAPAPVLSPQIDKLTRQVYDQLKRELRIERERRGL